MPLSGVRDLAPLTAGAPELQLYTGEPLVLQRAQILQLMFEIAGSTMQELLPKALHPTIPPTLTVVVSAFPDSPAGAFTLAQVRVGCRAGIRPRAFLLASYCDSEKAAQLLRGHWGFDCRAGAVKLRHQHDRAVATVETGGRTILDAQLIDPEFISGADVQYVPNMNLARVPSEGTLRPRLVQAEPEYVIHRAQRGLPRLATFDHAAWNAEGVEPVYPVSATIATCDVTLSKPRYWLNPDLPALQGTETVA